MKQTAVYMRVSTKKQDVARQELLVKQWLEGHNIIVPANDDFERLEQLIFNGQVGRVVTPEMERFARTMIAGLGKMDDWLRKYKVELVFIADKQIITPDSWESEIMQQLWASFKLAFAEQGRRTIRTNSKAGRKAAKKLHKQALEMSEKGLSAPAIAQLLNKPVGIVNKMLNTPIIEPYKYYWGGQPKNQAIQSGTDSLSQEIEELLGIGLGNNKIIKSLGISPSTYYRRLKILKNNHQNP
jgi:DNA invertase Pin-like site-specific DNA recombinase